MTIETPYQRQGRLQRERQKARAEREQARLAALYPPARKQRSHRTSTYDLAEQYGPDGLYRDNLGESPDY